MANELTIGASIAYADSEGSEDSLSVENFIKTITTKRFVHMKQNVAITEEALNLGDIASIGYILMFNRDATNFVEVRVSTGSTKMVRLDPADTDGNPGMALFRFGSGVTAPYVIADTATVQIEYLLIST